jgi:probable HAF family extracellular repeat protein
MQDLGTLPNGTWSWGYAVSADGAVIVGSAEGTNRGFRAIRWTQVGGMQDLGALGGPESFARGVSGDGTIIVGWADVPNSRYSRAFRWTQATGMQDLNQVYASLLTSGSFLIEAHGISPNGRYIVGWGWNNARRRFEGFLLDTGSPRRGDVDRNGCVDDADLLQVLFAFGERGYRNEDLNWDGAIDDADLLQVLFHFGSGC